MAAYLLGGPLPRELAPYRKNIEFMLGPPAPDYEEIDGEGRLPVWLFTSEEVERLLADGKAVIGNEGGLVVGRSHAQGGIPVLQKQPSGLYKLFAEFEGYEYLLNPGVAAFLPKLCEQANRPDIDRFFEHEDYEPQTGTKIIDLRTDQHPTTTKCLILDSRPSFFVVNKHSTKLKLSVLDEMNEQVTYSHWEAWYASIQAPKD